MHRLGLAATSALGAALLTSCVAGENPDGSTAPPEAEGSQQAPPDNRSQSPVNQHYIGGVPVQGARDGSTNDRSALEAANSIALRNGEPILLTSGTYRIAGSITLVAPVVALPGAIIRPDNGTVVTAAGGVVAGQYQIIDMANSGVVVPQKVDAYHPAWWGTIGTSNDTTTWQSMLISASYLPNGQAIHVPVGDTRLWELEIRNVHLQGAGRTRRILPALDVAKAGDPRNGTGFIVNLAGHTTVDGIDFDTDNVDGITAVFWTGSRVWMSGGRVRPVGADTVGIWACTLSDGSITPKMTNMWIEGNSSGASGVGVRYESHDGEMTNVTVGYCSTGIELLRGSAVLNTVHVFECKDDGVKGMAADHTRFVACYIEKNGRWGINFEDSSYITVDAGTRLWSNGRSGSNFGGARLKGSGGNETADNKVDAQFNDNVGRGLFLDGAQRTTGSMLLISYLGRRGDDPAGSTGLYITSATLDTDIQVRGPSAAPDSSTYRSVTGDVIVDESESER